MPTDDLKPGRELDALVAEKVMGLRRHDPDSDASDLAWEKIDDPYESFPLPPYSSDIAAAWEVVGKLGPFQLEASRGWTTSEIEFRCRFQRDKFWDEWGASSTAPHAICLAALKAVRHE